jgi:hypothetical protein
MVYLTDWKQYLICKDILVKFCHHFKTLPKNNLAFIMAQKDMIKINPELSSYFYQFLLEAAYHKKQLYDSDILLAFESKFGIKDIYNMNGGISDISTLNSAFVISHIINTTSFKKIPFTIYSTPLEYKSEGYELSQKNLKIQKIIELSRKTTGNTNCDVALGHRLYDIKHIEKDSINKNHILPWTYEKIEEKGLNHLQNLLGQLSLRNDKLKDYLLCIIKDKKLSIGDKIMAWNVIIEERYDKIPVDYKLPIVIPMTNKPYTPIVSKNVREEYHIPNDIAHNPDSARLAICGVLNKWDPIYKKNAMIMTENGLPFDNKSFDDVD